MTTGDVLLCDLNPVAGREQGGVRPVVVVSHPRYAAVPGLLKQVSYAMTEQVRAMSNDRAGRRLGRVGDDAIATISRYLHLFIA